MNLDFNNEMPGERFAPDKKPTYEEASELLQRLIEPNGTLVMDLPTGLGLDFLVQADGCLEVEFYSGDATDASNASVTRETAQQIVKRAFEGRSGKIKDIYSDLISEWNF